jgi:VWFA-related protein
MTLKNTRSLLLSCTLASTVVFAQAGQQAQAPQQAGLPQQAQPQQAPLQQAQQPVFRVAVDLVTTDAIVRDRQGQFVADLKKDDFEVYEDGVKQDIVSMILSHGGRVYNIQAPPPPPPQEGILLPPPRPTNDAAGRIFVLFIDDLHMDFSNTGRLRELVKKISKTLIHEGDLWGAVSSGPSSIAQDLTYDRNRLDEIIKKVSGAGLKPNEIIQGPEGTEGPTEVRYRAHVAFSTMYDFLKNLETVRDRRKAVIYISDGYDFNPFPSSRTDYQNQLTGQTNQSSSSDPNTQNQDTDPFEKTGQQFADADLVRELAELTRAANRANTSLYTIDPRGLVGGPDLDQSVDSVEWQDYLRKSQDSLRVLAENTGGLAVVNQNDFDKALKRIDNETSDYYVLGYYSSNPDPTIRTRKLEIKVKRPDVTVFSRQSYTLKRRPTAKK